MNKEIELFLLYKPDSENPGDVILMNYSINLIYFLLIRMMRNIYFSSRLEL